MKGIKLKNGYLMFADMDSFKATFNTLRRFNHEEKNHWEKQFPGFRSMRSAYRKIIHFISSHSDAKELTREIRELHDKIIMDYGDKEFDKIVLSDSLASTINVDGIVKIGEAIYKFCPNKVKIIKDGDETKIPQLDGIQESQADLNIEIKNTTQKLINELSPAAEAEKSSTTSCGKECTDEYKDNYRLKGKIFYNYYFIAEELGAYSKSQKYIWYLFGWYGNEVTKLKVGVAGEAKYTYSGVEILNGNTGSEEKYTDKVEVIILSEFYPVEHYEFNLYGEHWLNNGNDNGYCTTCRSGTGPYFS